jgi:amino acid permease
LGSGTLTFPYIFYENGIYMAILLILFGSSISVYTGWLVIKCAEYCNAARYEDIAM